VPVRSLDININSCHTGGFAHRLESPLVHIRVVFLLITNVLTRFVLVDNSHPSTFAFTIVELSDSESNIIGALLQNIDGSNLVVLVLVDDSNTALFASLINRNDQNRNWSWDLSILDRRQSWSTNGSTGGRRGWRAGAALLTIQLVAEQSNVGTFWPTRTLSLTAHLVLRVGGICFGPLSVVGIDVNVSIAVTFTCGRFGHRFPIFVTFDLVANILSPLILVNSSHPAY
jgi:hypothetical protein